MLPIVIHSRGRAHSIFFFDLIRLKGLLYENEFALVQKVSGLRQLDEYDDATKIMVDFTHFHNSDVVQDNRSTSSSTATNVGASRNDISGHAACALPVALLQIMRGMLMQPMSQKWGYPERVINLLEAHISTVSNCFEQLDRLITIPLPLAYLQHCKILFLIFVGIYPLTINTLHGVWANVFSPCCLFMALLGFEVLADEMENPIGDDTIDLNVMRMIHELEGRCCEIFDICELRRATLFKDLTSPLQDMGMDVISREHRRKDDIAVAGDFSYHFTWLPLPVHIMAYCADKEHGVGNEFLEASGLQAPASGFCRCCNCPCTCCDKVENQRKFNEEVVQKMAAKYHLVTQFFSLRRKADAIRSECRSQFECFLGNTSVQREEASREAHYMAMPTSAQSSPRSSIPPNPF